MGPIKTNWPSATLPPSKRKSRKARDARDAERMAAYVAAQNVDAIRARFRRISAERDGAPTLTEQQGDADPLTPAAPSCTPVPVTVGRLHSRREWRDMQAHVPSHVAAFWNK